MIEVDHELTVERPPEDVFAYVTDAGNLAEWNDGVVEARQDTPGPVARGTRFTEVRNFLGRRIESSPEVVEYEANRLFTLKTAAGPVPFTVEQRFEPVGAGATRIVVHAAAEPGGFFRLAEPIVARQARRMIEHNFDTLKDLLESRG